MAAKQLSISRLQVDIKATREGFLIRVRQALQHDLNIVRQELKLERERKKQRRTQPIDAGGVSSQRSSHGKTSPAAVVNRQDYCDYRPQRRGALTPYRRLSTGRPCTCAVAHPRLHPRDWKCSPAEADWDYGLPNGGHPSRNPKVRFADDVGTEVRHFERWYQDEYEYSDRYWAKGPVRPSTDRSSELDDAVNISWDDAMHELELKVSGICDDG